MKQSLSLTLLIGFLCMGWSVEAQDLFRYKRKIAGVHDGWHRVVLPDDIYQHVRPDLADIRIYQIHEEDTTEVPFVREGSAAAMEADRLAFALINASKNDSGYFYTFDARAPEVLNEVELHPGLSNFDWSVRLDGSNDLKDWFTIKENARLVGIQNAEATFSYTRILFPDSKYRYFRVLIRSKEDPRLTSATVHRPVRHTSPDKTYEPVTQQASYDKSRKQTTIFIKLPYKVPVSGLVIPVRNGSDYYRPVQVSYLSDSARRGKDWYYEYTRLITTVLQSGKTDSTHFPNTLVQKLRIEIDEGDNAPLQIQKMAVFGHPYSLTARFNGGDGYYLFYGKQHSRAPDYDLINFVKSIPDTLTSVVPGEEMRITQTAQQLPLFRNEKWLWLVIAVVIILLGYASITMIRKKG